MCEFLKDKASNIMVMFVISSSAFLDILYVPHASPDKTHSKYMTTAYIDKLNRCKHLVIMYISYVLSDLMYGCSHLELLAGP